MRECPTYSGCIIYCFTSPYPVVIGNDDVIVVVVVVFVVNGDEHILVAFGDENIYNSKILIDR